MFKKEKIDKHYVSKEDIFLEELRQKAKKSASQLEEIKKHERIFKLRDKNS